MPAIFSPRIYNGSTTLELPLPIHKFPIQDVWKFKETKVPRKSGSKTHGESKDSYVLTIEGEFGRSGIDGTVYGGDEEAMWERYETIRSHIDVLNGNKSLELFWFFDDSSDAYYRKYKSVVPRGFAVNLGDEANRQFGYSLSLLIRNLTIYDTEPGA